MPIIIDDVDDDDDVAIVCFLDVIFLMMMPTLARHLRDAAFRSMLTFVILLRYFAYFTRHVYFCRLFDDDACCYVDVMMMFIDVDADAADDDAATRFDADAA